MWAVVMAGAVLLASPSCKCGKGPNTNAKGNFTTEEVAQICVTLESCFPLEWDATVWGGSLADCTSQEVLFSEVPLPAQIVDSTIRPRGLDGPFAVVYRCLLDVN